MKRYPTPYPDELKNMVKTVQTIVHRLKDEETTEDAGKESKKEGQQVSVKDVGVKVRINSSSSFDSCPKDLEYSIA